MGLITCVDCGSAVSDSAVSCPQCGRPLAAAPVQSQDLGQNAVARMLLPVGRSGWAIAAGYLGLISITLVPAPLALITGILAIVDIKKHPERHGMGRAVFGVIMGALFTVVLVMFLLRSR